MITIIAIVVIQKNVNDDVDYYNDDQIYFWTSCDDKIIRRKEGFRQFIALKPCLWLDILSYQNKYWFSFILIHRKLNSHWRLSPYIQVEGLNFTNISRWPITYLVNDLNPTDKISQSTLIVSSSGTNNIYKIWGDI